MDSYSTRVSLPAAYATTGLIISNNSILYKDQTYLNRVFAGNLDITLKRAKCENALSTIEFQGIGFVLKKTLKKFT